MKKTTRPTPEEMLRMVQQAEEEIGRAIGIPPEMYGGPERTADAINQRIAAGRAAMWEKLRGAAGLGSVDGFTFHEPPAEEMYELHEEPRAKQLFKPRARRAPRTIDGVVIARTYERGG